MYRYLFGSLRSNNARAVACADFRLRSAEAGSAVATTSRYRRSSVRFVRTWLKSTCKLFFASSNGVPHRLQNRWSLSVIVSVEPVHNGLWQDGVVGFWGCKPLK